MNKNFSFIASGIFFSIFWASASVAGKFGLMSVEPLVLFNIRFLLAGSLLLLFAYLFQEWNPPSSFLEWKQLAIFGMLNTTLYLGIFIFALQQVSPGITTLAVALNPLFISTFSALWIRRKVSVEEWLSIAIGILGVAVASYPLLMESHATTLGLFLLAISMVAYSVGAVYFANVTWTVSRTSVNGWQALLGGLFLIPFTFFFHRTENNFDFRFWFSLAWLVIPVSIAAIQLWLRLVKTDAVKASLWLYLCPLFGFLYASLLLNEKITLYTVGGTALVLCALYIGQRRQRSQA
jgi:drug/metabolite transporter (DMT)-like permease